LHRTIGHATMGGNERNRFPARHQRRPPGHRHDVACPPTGIPHFRWVTGPSCCPFG